MKRERGDEAVRGRQSTTAIAEAQIRPGRGEREEQLTQQRRPPAALGRALLEAPHENVVVAGVFASSSLCCCVVCCVVSVLWMRLGCRPALRFCSSQPHPLSQSDAPPTAPAAAPEAPAGSIKAEARHQQQVKRRVGLEDCCWPKREREGRRRRVVDVGGERGRPSERERAVRAHVPVVSPAAA